MQRLIAAGQCPIEDLDVVGDDLMKWRFKIRAFDDTTQGETKGNNRAVRSWFCDTLLMEPSADHTSGICVPN